MIGVKTTICQFCVVVTCCNPKKNNLPSKCIVCNKTRAQYVSLGFKAQFDQMVFLRTAWFKSQIYKQKSTGCVSIDTKIVDLWGKPHIHFGEKKCMETT